MANERLEKALEWAKERNLGSKQLNLFDWQYQKELDKDSRRKRDNKKLKEKKAQRVAGIIKGNKAGIDQKEFKEMCKKAGVEPGSLAKTILTRNIESS